MKELIRTCRFSPYRKGCGPKFTLKLYHTGRVDELGKSILGYELKQDKEVIFSGEDFLCSPMHCVDSDETVAGIMGFLTCRPGDTEEEYFAKYTPRQLEYCEQHAEWLYCAVSSRFPDFY